MIPTFIQSSNVINPVYNYQQNHQNHHYNQNDNNSENDDYSMDIDESYNNRNKINEINQINKTIKKINPLNNTPLKFLKVQMKLLEFQIKYSKSDVGQSIRNKFECLIEDIDYEFGLGNNNINYNNNNNNNNNNKFYINKTNSNSINKYNNFSNNSNFNYGGNQNINNNNNKFNKSIFKIQYEMFKLQSSIAGDKNETISMDIRNYFKKMFINNSDKIESSSLYTFLQLLKLYNNFLSTLILNQLNQEI